VWDEKVDGLNFGDEVRAALIKNLNHRFDIIASSR